MKLNAEQQAAAEFQGSHLLVLAGAGTGKTRTIVARAAHLISEGVDPRRILALTFTRRAAAELVGRLKTQVGPAAEKIRAGTFHSFCLHTMRHFSTAFGLDRMTVIDRDDQLELVGLARAQVIREKEKAFPKKERIAELISYARNTNVTLEAYLGKLAEFEPEEIERLKKVEQAYSTRKQLRSYLDYDDILVRFARALHTKSLENLRNTIAAQYDHILVDEMQDTNPLQWLILKGLDKHAKLYCVGDDAQSIYSFRGADFQNVHSFTERVSGGAILPLVVNYRSTQPILDLANWLLDQSPLNYKKHLVSARGGGMRPKLMEFDSPASEAAWLAEDILDKLENGEKLQEIMILVRSAWTARQLEAALIEKAIPYRFIGGTQLMQTAHVKDLLGLLRAALSERDELAWSRYLRLFERVGDATAMKIVDQVAALKSAELAVEQLPQILQSAGKIPQANDIIEGLRAIQHNQSDPEAALSAAVAFLNPRQKKRYENWKDRARDYDLLITLAKRHNSLGAFLETYTLDPVSATYEQAPESDDVLTLITVHSAKGTESKICYVLKVQPGVYPDNRSLDDLNEIEEDRRVLYVALTRAQNELILTRVAERFGRSIFFGGTTGRVANGGTTDFLEHWPAELLEHEVHGFQSSPFEDFGPIMPLDF